MNKFIVSLLAVAIVFASPLAQAKKEWDERKGRNFILYYRDVPDHFVETVMEEAENDFTRISESLGITRYQGWAWDKRAVIYIYRDEADYMQNAGQAGWSHGATAPDSKIIRTYPSANGFFDSLLPHELGHIILHEIIGPFASVPLWFDEGVAMFQEKARRFGAHAQVKKYLENGQFIPLTRLMDVRLYKTTDQATVELFYTESASIVNFMIMELGQRHFYRLCQELKDFTGFEFALSQIYGSIRDVEGLNKAWIRFLEEQ